MAKHSGKKGWRRVQELGGTKDTGGEGPGGEGLGGLIGMHGRGQALKPSHLLP